MLGRGLERSLLNAKPRFSQTALRFDSACDFRKILPRTTPPLHSFSLLIRLLAGKDHHDSDPPMKQHHGIVLYFVLGILFATWTVSSAVEGMDPSTLKLEEQKVTEWRKEREDFFRNHQRSPLSPSQKRNFKGLKYYPFNPQWLFSGQIERYVLHINNPEYYATFLTNKGTNKRYIRYGRFRFNVGGKVHTLEIFKSLLSDQLFIPFKDMTNGKETYEGGRYIEAEILPGYQVVVDFNRAYNPSCVYDDRFACVVPPKENTLALEVRAGERNWK